MNINVVKSLSYLCNRFSSLVPSQLASDWRLFFFLEPPPISPGLPILRFSLLSLPGQPATNPMPLAQCFKLHCASESLGWFVRCYCASHRVLIWKFHFAYGKMRDVKRDFHQGGLLQYYF